MWTLWSMADGWLFLLAFQKYNPLKIIDQLDKEKVQNIVMYLRQGWEGGEYFFPILEALHKEYFWGGSSI